MAGPTAEQLLQAARNTAQAPRNSAPAARQALKNEKMPAGYLDAMRRLYGVGR